MDAIHIFYNNGVYCVRLSSVDCIKAILLDIDISGLNLELETFQIILNFLLYEKISDIETLKSDISLCLNFRDIFLRMQTYNQYFVDRITQNDFTDGQIEVDDYTNDFTDGQIEVDRITQMILLMDRMKKLKLT